MFEKFVRHDSQALRGATGSGLGLAIAKRLVEMRDGKIGLETGADGIGSLAWFSLLLATARDMSGDRERLLETSDADGYLEKPVYDSAILVQKVRRLIENAPAG